MQNRVFFNLTQHNLTSEQVADLTAKGFAIVETNDEIRQLITFTGMPTRELMIERALAIVAICEQHKAQHDICQALVGGAPAFQRYLENALKFKGLIHPVHAQTNRESMEFTNEKGEVVKTNVFRHLGFIPVSFENPFL